MPWLETDPVNERKRFVLEAQADLFSHSELCYRHGISRKTGYKWLETDFNEVRPHEAPRQKPPASVKQFKEMQKFMKRMKGLVGGIRGMSGMPGMGGGFPGMPFGG